MPEIFYIKIDAEKLDTSFEADAQKFPEKIRTKINAYKSEKHRLHDYFGKKLLQYVLKRKQLNYTLNDLQYTEKDRPFFAENNFDFNISHSGYYVVLAFSDTTKIGVDIELHRDLQIEDFKKYFSIDEWHLIENSKNPLQQFFDFWTIKEATIKCNGNGFSVLSKTEIIDAKTTRCVNKNYNYRLLAIDKNYSFSVCSDSVLDKMKLMEVSTQSIYNFR